MQQSFVVSSTLRNQKQAVWIPPSGQSEQSNAFRLSSPETPTLCMILRTILLYSICHWSRSSQIAPHLRSTYQPLLLIGDPHNGFPPMNSLHRLTSGGITPSFFCGIFSAMHFAKRYAVCRIVSISNHSQIREAKTYLRLHEKWHSKINRIPPHDIVFVHQTAGPSSG